MSYVLTWHLSKHLKGGDVFGTKEVIWGPSLVMFLDERRSFGARVGDAFGPKEVIRGPRW